MSFKRKQQRNALRKTYGNRYLSYAYKNGSEATDKKIQEDKEALEKKRKAKENANKTNKNN